MSLPILFTPRAYETFNTIYDFIKGEFGSGPANKFQSKAEKVIASISQNPFMFKASPIDEKVRVGLINKQTSLFYRVNETSIHLLFFWDNRQEPIFLY